MDAMAVASGLLFDPGLSAKIDKNVMQQMQGLRPIASSSSK